MNRIFARALLAPAAVAIAIAVAGCDPDGIAPNGRANAPLSDKTLAELNQKNMDKGSPILVRIFKEEAELEVWKQDRSGQYALLKTYPVCRWSGDLGPKIKEGDRQAPEGFYTITPGLMNPNSNYYLAFNTGYPNTYDRSWGHTGSELMVHGDCSSRGCYAMTDEQMVEIYALAREAFFGGQKAFQFEAFPFRMTAMNMAKHRNSPHYAFWKMLKVGYDHFDVTKQEPKVDVCERRYVFDAAAPDNATRINFSPKGKCPVYRLDPQIASAVMERQRFEDTKIAEYTREKVTTVSSRRGDDGGMNPVFASQLAYHDESDNNGRLTRLAGNTQAPGSLPHTPNQGSTRIVVGAAAQKSAPEPQPEVETETTVAMATVPVPRPAPEPKEGQAPAEEQQQTIGGLIDTMFKPKEEPKPAAKPAETKVAGIQTYPVEMPPALPPALRGSKMEIADAKPEPAPIPAPKPKAPAPARVFAGVVTSPVAMPERVMPEAPQEKAQEKPKTVLASAPPREVAPRPTETAPVETSPVVTSPAVTAPMRPKVVAAAPHAVEHPKPETRVAHVAPPPAAPKKPEPRPEPKVAKHEAPPVRRAPRPQPEIRTAYSAPLASGSLMMGAQPTVAAGSFTR